MGNLTDIDKNFEPSGPPTEFSLLPKGEYLLELRNSERKDTAMGDGAYLNCEFEVLEPGEYGSRRIFQKFNIKNKSEECVKIGMGQLSALSRACGFDAIPDESYQLHDRKFTGYVTIQKSRDPQYKDTNKISSFTAYKLPSVVFKAKDKNGTTEAQQKVVTEELFQDDIIRF